MFQRGDPEPGDPHLSHVYGLALPLLKRGMPVTPVQLENLTVANYLEGFRLLLLSYQGQKPLTPEVHPPLAEWVRRGGLLAVVDDDSDHTTGLPSGGTAEETITRRPGHTSLSSWGLTMAGWNSNGAPVQVGKGRVLWLRENPARLAAAPEGDRRLTAVLKESARAGGLKWRESNYLLLRRGPYVVAAGLDESLQTGPRTVRGRFVNLFDAGLALLKSVTLTPGSRWFLLDLDRVRPRAPQVLASACKALPLRQEPGRLVLKVEGVADTQAIVLVGTAKPPRSIRLGGEVCPDYAFAKDENLLRIRFANQPAARELEVTF